jgi:acyl-coenzyme A synthetase/AMP-(fatty) acid ligase
MNRIFLQHNNKNWSYIDLIKDINTSINFSNLIFSSFPYEIFKQIILCLINGKDCTIYDHDFSEEELLNLNFIRAENEDKYLNKRNYNSFDGLKNDLLNSKGYLTLFTSGTTGKPKAIKHPVTNFIRSLKTGDKYNYDVWGFAYNPTHIAGLSVFFQAFMNNNEIVYLFDKKSDEIESLLLQYQVTHISATPTFYRMILPLKKTNSVIKRITLGGERAEINLIETLGHNFPNAKINNIYATTEFGTLFISNGEYFVLKPDMRALVKIKDNELIVHENLLGKSDDLMVKNGWYKTGDIVEVINDNPLTIKFAGRKSDMINVGGYKVNPAEIEEIIRRIPDIISARVYGKTNSVTGNIVLCDIVKNEESNLTEKDLKDYLSEFLQPFKIPAMFFFKNKVDLTRTTKIKR